MSISIVGGKKMNIEKCICFDGKTCPIERAITQRTNQNYQPMFPLLKKIIIQKKY
jgi:hypothetical protein